LTRRRKKLEEEVKIAKFERKQRKLATKRKASTVSGDKQTKNPKKMRTFVK